MSYVDGTAAADWQRAAHLSNDKSQARIGPMASRRFSGTSMPRCRAQDRGFSSDGGKEDKDGSQQQFLDFAGTGGGTAPNRPGGLATSEGGVDTQSKTIPFRHASIDQGSHVSVGVTPHPESSFEIMFHKVRRKRLTEDSPAKGAAAEHAKAEAAEAAMVKVAEAP